MEDGAAILGLSIAAVCLSLSYFFANPIFDAIGSILIGFLLGNLIFKITPISLSDIHTKHPHHTHLTVITQVLS
jgi:divalent metal cation (Fe/Co/Zn/Cd) transporter